MTYVKKVTISAPSTFVTEHFAVRVNCTVRSLTAPLSVSECRNVIRTFTGELCAEISKDLEEFHAEFEELEHQDAPYLAKDKSIIRFVTERSLGVAMVLEVKVTVCKTKTSELRVSVRVAELLKKAWILPMRFREITSAQQRPTSGRK